MFCGGLALLAGVVSYWAGPFAEEPTLSQSVSETAAAMRDALLEEIGEKPKAPPKRFYEDWDEDRMLSVGVAVGGGLAVLLGFVGFARGEEVRVAASGAILGALALVFQLVVSMG